MSEIFVTDEIVVRSPTLDDEEAYFDWVEANEIIWRSGCRLPRLLKRGPK